jgi:hypothetical protein
MFAPGAVPAVVPLVGAGGALVSCGPSVVVAGFFLPNVGSDGIFIEEQPLVAIARLAAARLAAVNTRILLNPRVLGAAASLGGPSRRVAGAG